MQQTGALAPPAAPRLNYLHHDAAGHRQVSVEPGVPDAAAVALHAHLQHALLRPLGARLHLQQEAAAGPGGGDGTGGVRGRTLRQGLSVCAPIMEKPFPGRYFPPTAKAIRLEKFLVTKYCREDLC